MTASLEPHRAILKAIPHLRAFATSLTGDMDRADDLVQETLTKALGHLHQFESGTNMRSWLFTILRNQYHTQFRRRRWEIEDPNGLVAQQVTVPPAQIGHLELQDLWSALRKLPPQNREALLLVSVEGVSYEEAARICGISIGALKTRVNRARRMLTKLMGEEVWDNERATTTKAAPDASLAS